MKKTVAAAVAAAVVMGASSTSFAALNPFSDVPTDHWAYEAVGSLIQSGIIDYYRNSEDTFLNGKFVGERKITRYEVAQLVAKALARTDEKFDRTAQSLDNGQSFDRPDRNYHATKADLENLRRLVEEFRPELERLGVLEERVDEMWKYHDKVSWTGELRYRYYNDKEDRKGTSDKKRTNNQLQLRLFPTAEVNKHLKVKARLTASNNMKTNTSGDFKLTYAFAEGKFGKLQINVGKMPFYTNVDDGLVMDDFFSGVAAVYGDKFKVALMAGRWDLDSANLNLPAGATLSDNAASYQGAEISYDNSKLYLGAGYHHFRSDDFRNLPGYKNDKNANVWTVGARYNFSDFGLGGAYASNTKADDFKRSWWAGLSYKGANRKEAGTWGVSAAYRYVGQNVSLAPTYDTFALRTNKKGVDVGLDWSPWKNTYAQLGYFWGKTLDTHQDDRTFFGRFSWFF